MATLFGKKKRKREQEIALDGINDCKSANLDGGKRCIENDDRLERNVPVQPAQAVNERPAQQTALPPPWATTFSHLGLSEPLVATCRRLGLHKPTPVQRAVIPHLLRQSAIETRHGPVLALASTGSGKTAAFVLPILQHLSHDPYGIFAVLLAPTRELAVQLHQQVLALGSAWNVTSTLVVGGLDRVQQSLQLDQKPHVCVATPGRLAELLRGPQPPSVQLCRYVVLDEADRLLAPHAGFERDVAYILSVLHADLLNVAGIKRRMLCQTLLFSATMTRSLESIEQVVGMNLQHITVEEDGSNIPTSAAGDSTNERHGPVDDETTNERNGPLDDDADDDRTVKLEETPVLSVPKIPAGLKQEYLFMPSRVRDTYLLATLRELMWNGGCKIEGEDAATANHFDDDAKRPRKARSAILFVATCERAALVSGVLDRVGISNVCLHAMLSQNRRLAALAKFKSHQVRVLVATDVASRGLDIPMVDLVVNVELPSSGTTYVHRVGRTARAGQRGRAVSLVAEFDVRKVHAAEAASGRELEKCTDVTDDMAIQLLSSVAKAVRLAKRKLLDIGFDELVQKFKARKAGDKKERQRIDRALKRMTERGVSLSEPL